MADQPIQHEGHNRLWLWFGLSRASFLTMPRVLMHEMPDEWQAKMADLLREYDEAWKSWPEGCGARVQYTVDGKPARMPRWLQNYRHPDREAIAQLRGGRADG